MLLAIVRQVDNEVKKGPRLCRHVMPRRVVGVKGILLVSPIGKEIDHSPLRNEMLGTEKKHLSNPGTGQACIDQGAGIIDRQPSPGVNHNAFAPAMEFPRERFARLRVTEFQASVVSAFEIFWLCRASAASDVRRRSDRYNTRIEQLSRDQRRRFGLTESQRKIEAVHDEITKVVSRDELDFEVRMRIHELVQPMPEYRPVENRIQIDSQPSAHARPTDL